MITFLSDSVLHKYIQSWVYTLLGPIERKQNKLAVNTKVGQLFLVGLSLRHYFVDSNIRDLGYRRVSYIKNIFSLYIFFISVVFTKLPRTPNHFPCRDIGPETHDPRLLVKLFWKVVCLSVSANQLNELKTRALSKFVGLWKNLLVLIYSKLHSKSCD